ncbi:NAD(P)H-dependent oxidoreductase [Streptomyces sp. NA04227]|uniref:FMN-dependent NADH-azoreductase n=1 Tax=Streptomyces sp. NA04227 TaxID=2742136 RepID=UPI0015919BFB|nr:NAD(P)H-dependent oxidoreductase [Streptomyces sp. NA04227]QKW07581.1 NAD(P)H-dependent oxidoreductase [Streptomyces sp. NA04227]
MATLLHIDTSLNGDRSFSRQVAAQFRQAWEAEHPDGQVVYRDLDANPLPHLRAAEYYAGLSDPAGHSPEEEAAFALRRELIEEAEGADALLIGAPLYNYSIPSSLKSWIDHVIAFGRTVGTEAPTLKGKPAVVVTSRGGGYGPGSPNEGRDYLQPYLEWILGGSLGLDLEFIVPELTMAPVNPAMASLIPLHETSLSAAHEAAATKGKALAGRLAA